MGIVQRLKLYYLWTHISFSMEFGFAGNDVGVRLFDPEQSGING